MNTEKQENLENQCFGEDTNMDFSSKLLKDIASLYLNQECSDVSFIIQGQKIHAHKVILAVRSSYFKKLLFGGFTESSKSEIPMTDVFVDAFKQLLKYIYTGSITIVSANLELALRVLDLAHKYCMYDLETLMDKELGEMLDADNLFEIMVKAQKYNLSKLLDGCLNFVDEHADDILKSGKLKNQSEEVVIQVLERDTFRLPEINVFEIVAQWCQNNGRTSKDLLKCVRLSDLTLEEIFSVVKPTKLVENDVLIEAISEISGIKPKASPSRRIPLSLPNINVATLEQKAQIINSHNSADCSFVLDDNKCEEKLVSCAINVEHFMVKLGRLVYINNINILLSTKPKKRYYRYYIEASTNATTWKKIVDYGSYDCRGLQKLYFEVELVQYLKLVGVYSSEGNTIDIASFDVFLKENVPKLVNGIVSSSSDVAKLSKHATVIEGIDNGLLKVSNKCSSHTIGNGSIVIQLAQPFMVNTIKMYCYFHPYKSRYYIEGSINRSDWTVLVDKRNEDCYSWQNLTFVGKPVVYIRITGTYCTFDNNNFYCQFFQCYADKDL